MSPRGKLILPTVDTCRFRQMQAAHGTAWCGLISELIGVQSGNFALVTDDVCQACCRSFPPTKRRLNPVVASLLHRAALSLLAEGDSAKYSTHRARDLLDLADQWLDFHLTEGLTITPVRNGQGCLYCGQESRAAPMTNGANTDAGGEPLFECSHPAHDYASAARCRMCSDWSAEQARSRLLTLAELVPPGERRYGGQVTEWAVGITTAPRRRPTLESCLDSICRAGWDRPRLYLDGVSPLPERYDHLPLSWREESVGAFPAWLLALLDLVLQQPTADAYFLLQDDVVLYDRQSLREYLEEILWPGERAGMVTLFYTGFDARPGWHLMREGCWCGAQAFVFSSEVARRIAADGELIRIAMAAAAGGHVRIPETLFDWVRRNELEVWYANPSLAQHIGNTSTIWLDSALAGGRRAPWFAGGIETPFAVEEPLDGFPEDAFPVPAEFQNGYRARVERGRALMREQSVVICGLCRDVRHHLPRMAARIERLGAMFADWRAIFYENDSADATKEFLLDWKAANPRIELITEALNLPRFPQAREAARAEWLARCRNVCRGHVLAAFRSFSHVIVVDMDLAGGFSLDGIAHTFGEPEWDFVGSYGIAQGADPASREAIWRHVDAWAFRPLPGSPEARLSFFDELQLTRGQPLLPVESCFGGLGVYHMDCYAAAAYAGSDCEHVVLHERQRQAGFARQFLNPSQIVLYTPV